MRTAMGHLQVPPPPPGTPGPLSRPTPEALGGLLEAAGFSNVEVEEAEVTFEWQSPEEFTTFIKEIAPPITAMIAPHPQEVQDETWAAITKAIREATGDGGAVRLSNLVLLAAGRGPSRHSASQASIECLLIAWRRLAALTPRAGCAARTGRPGDHGEGGEKRRQGNGGAHDWIRAGPARGVKRDGPALRGANLVSTLIKLSTETEQVQAWVQTIPLFG